MGWPICRIDGQSGPLERREEMHRFQTGGDDPDAPRLFLLSTRAGGLGINLVAADTVIFYDQDWVNLKSSQFPFVNIYVVLLIRILKWMFKHKTEHIVLVRRGLSLFLDWSLHIRSKLRLCSARRRSASWRFLLSRKVSISKRLFLISPCTLTEYLCPGKFKMPAGAASTKKETMAEMAAALLRLESEKIEVVPDTKEGKQGVLSDADLDVLLDRRPEVFSERRKGWVSGAGGVERDSMDQEVTDVDHVAVGAGKKAAFAVYEAPVEEGNDSLAKMLGEEEG